MHDVSLRRVSVRLLLGTLLFCCLLFAECVSGTPFWTAALLSLAPTLLLSGLLALLPARGARIAAIVLGAAVWFFYLSQAVYCRVFQTNYPLYSLLHGGQVFSFWRQIMSAFSDRLPQMLLLCVPLAALLLFLRRLTLPDRAPRLGLTLVFLALLAQSLAVSLLPLGGTEAGTAYDLYRHDGGIRATAQKLGVLTAFRLDATRTLLGGTQDDALAAVTTPLSEVDAAPPAPIEYADNALDIDFDALLADTTRSPQLHELDSFYAARTPTKQNEMTDVFEGCNLIYLTAEGFSPYAVDPVLTPTLYKLVHEGVNFTNFYNPIWNVSTIDGEYVNTLGLIPKQGCWSLYQSREHALPFALGNQFRRLGYLTNAYHDHTFDYYRREVSHPALGYDYKGLGSGVVVTKVWPESDLEMMQTTVPEYIGSSPFHVYYMTVSGHMEYNFFGNAQSAKHEAEVAGLPYSDACRAYVACHIELDRAMASLLQQLEDAGIAENTVIAMAPDHYPYGLTDEQLSEFLGHPVDPVFERYQSTLILYKKGMEPRTVDKLCWSADIMPTLSNLFGLPYDSRLMTGRDIFSTASPFIIFDDHSFITDQVRYNAQTGEATWATGSAPSDDYLPACQQAVSAEFAADARIVETDYYRSLGLSS